MNRILTLLALLCCTPAAFAQLTISSVAGPTPSYVVAATSTVSFNVINISGAAVAGATTRIDVPAGMNLMGTSGTNWSCTPNTAADPVGAVTCTFTGAIPSGGTSSILNVSLQPRRAVQNTSPSIAFSVDPTGGAAPPAGCTALNTPSPGCGNPLVAAVPAAQSNVHMGPRGDAGNTKLNNILTNWQHYDAVTWPQPDFSTLTGNIVVVSPKTIRNTGNIPWSFGLIQGNKAVNYSQNPGFFDYTGSVAGLMIDNAQDITSEVSFDNGGTWIQLKSAVGLSSNTTNLTKNIHTVDPGNVPLGGYVLQPGQSLDFLVRHTWPNARYTGRTDLTINIYAGLYMPGTQQSLSNEGFINITGPRNWVGPNGETGVWAGIAPTNEIFESTLDSIITGSIHGSKTQAVTNATGMGAATDPVSGSVITYTITVRGQIPNTTNNTALTAGPFLQPFRLPATSAGVRLIEDGTVAPNNWASFTDAVPGTATCTVPATIAGDVTGSTLYTFDLTNPLQAGQTASCSFQRRVR